MNYLIKNRLWFLMVLFTIFATIPQMIRLNFIGAVFAEKLSFFPLFVGLLLTLFYEKWNFVKTPLSKVMGIYLLVYIGVLFISLIHGLMIYPYYENILSGPVSQVEKIPMMQAFLQHLGVDVSKTALLKLWMFGRPIKTFFVTTFWTFSCSYLIYYWFRKDKENALYILTKGALIGAILVCIYGILDVWYLSGCYTAQAILSTLNPLVHDIKSNGTWWPPLLWKKQLRSLFAEPSYFGIWCAFAMPWIWYAFCKAKQHKEKIGLIALLFVLFLFLFLTNARTANVLIIGEVVLLLVAGIIYKSFLLKKVLIMLMCIACAFGSGVIASGILPGSPEAAKVESKAGHQKTPLKSGENLKEGSKLAQKYVENNITSVASDNKRSNGARFSIFAANIKLGIDYPLLGVGSSLRSAYVPDYLPQKAFSNGEVKMWIKNQKEKGIMKSGFPSLGEYASRFAETGLIGLCVFLLPSLFLLLLLVRKIKNETTEFEEKEQYIFFAISFCGILASGMGDSINITCCYWLLLGLGYALCFDDAVKK